MHQAVKNRLYWALFCAIIAVGCGGSAILISGSVAGVLICIAVPALFLTVGFLLTALFSRRSPYGVFAITVAGMAAILCGIGVWDMLTDTSQFFPGLLGLMILLFVLPTAAVLLLADLAAWCISRRKKERDKP